VGGEMRIQMWRSRLEAEGNFYLRNQNTAELENHEQKLRKIKN